MFCGRCGNELSQNDIFCGRCGQRMIDENEEKEMQSLKETKRCEDNSKTGETPKVNEKGFSKNELLLRLIITVLIIFLCFQPWLTVPNFVEIRYYKWLSIVDRLDYLGVDSEDLTQFGFFVFLSVTPMFFAGFNVLAILADKVEVKGFDVCGLAGALIGLAVSIQLKTFFDDYIFYEESICEISSALYLVIILFIVQISNVPKKIAEEYLSKYK